ncbi:MAG: TetR/AcrR family transcriptional regulator [Rhizobiales bacterium]|nr:TetR/AcrR family transcriptional regulator [Rhizobacter sp.]
MTRPTFQEQVFKVREDAIVAAVNRLLAEKGFDLMTVDEVATEVGIGKASLYKHFASKEDLAAAAMAFVLEGALSHAAQLAADTALADFDRLVSMARWAVQRQISGEMPALPAQNPTLREAMVRHAVYMERLVRLGDQLGVWIESARASGQLDPALPAEFTLYSLFAKGCDPVVFIMKESGQYSDAQIVEWAVRACFFGVAGRPDARP